MRKENIVGGLGDNITIKDISKKFNVPIEYVLKQLKKGISVEIEHSKDNEIAREIALDHLSEFPDYYDRLENLEKEAKNRWILKETIRTYIKFL